MAKINWKKLSKRIAFQLMQYWMFDNLNNPQVLSSQLRTLADHIESFKR